MVAATQNRIQLLPVTTITTAVTAVVGAPFVLDPDCMSVALQAVLVYGSGGTNATVYVQTSIDGTNWADIASFQFTTASLVKVAAVDGYLAHTHATALDGSLTANTVLQGFIGGRLRVKYTTTGTYGGSTTLAVSALPKSSQR